MAVMKRTPRITVDAVVFNTRSQLLLIQRRYEPFKGMWALPGGHVEEGETCQQAVMRELHEETGLKLTTQCLIGVYDRMGRDPRGDYLSVAYLMAIPNDKMTIRPGDDAGDVFWCTDWADRTLAFDHGSIAYNGSLM